MGAVNHSEFRRGDENRPPPPRFRKYPVEWQNIPSHTKPKNHPPADKTSSGRVIDVTGGRAHPGSLPEGAGSPQGLTEGVSSDGCSMPTIYTPAHFGSVIFERLRSSKYTPSVSRSLDSSLREGAGNELCHSIGCSLSRKGAGDFHRPYETQKFLHFTIHRGACETARLRFAIHRGSKRMIAFVGECGIMWGKTGRG